MFVVTGVSGNTGSVVADRLLAAGAKVRVVVRSAEKGEPWKARGAEVPEHVLTDAYDRLMHRFRNDRVPMQKHQLSNWLPSANPATFVRSHSNREARNFTKPTVGRARQYSYRHVEIASCGGGEHQ